MSSQLVVRIPEEQKLMLEVIASNQQASVAEITRLATRKYVQEKGKGKDSLFARLVKIGMSKKVGKTPRDLSENYKKHLYKT